jgi:hypothetical protein
VKKKVIVTAFVVLIIAALVPFVSATGKGETPAAGKAIITVTNWTGSQSGSGRTQINQMDTVIGKMLA